MIEQVAFPWLFTVDPLGWSAGSSAYPCDYRAGDPESGTFERYVERVVGRNGSKYEQRPTMDRRALVARLRQKRIVLKARIHRRLLLPQPTV